MGGEIGGEYYNNIVFKQAGQTMIGESQNTRYKLIKLYKIQSKDPSIQIVQIKERLINFINWSTIDDAIQVKEQFLQFPTDSIYQDGVHMSYRSGAKLYQFELIKADRASPHFPNCFYYQYLFNIFYDDPSAIVKSLGYQHIVRTAKSATVFKSLKYGLEVIITLQEKIEESIEKSDAIDIKRAKIEVIQTSSLPISPANSMISKTDKLFEDLVVIVNESELDHVRLTIKNWEKIEKPDDKPKQP